MDDFDKPTSARDRAVNNVELSGWLSCPVEKKQSSSTGSWYLSTKLLIADDKPLAYIGIKAYSIS